MELNVKVAFSINAKKLLETVSKIAKLVGRTVDNLEINITKSKTGEGSCIIKVVGDNQRIVYGRMAVEVEHAGMFTISRDTFEKILRNREEVSFIATSEGLSFTAKGTRYTGKNIPLLPVPTDKIIFPKPVEDAFSDSLQAKLIMLFNSAAINAIYSEDSIPMHIAIRGDKLIVAAADNLHAVITTLSLSKEETKNTNIKDTTIPTEYAGLFSVFIADGLRLSVNSSNITIQNNDFYVTLPSLQVGKLDLNSIMQMQQNSKKPSFSCTIDGSSMNSVLENLMVAHEAGAGTLVEYNKNNLFFSYKTSYGHVKDAVSVDNVFGKGNIVLESENLFDILSKVTGKITLNMYRSEAGGGWVEFIKELSSRIKAHYFVTALMDDTSIEPVKKEKKDNAKSTGDA